MSKKAKKAVKKRGKAKVPVKAEKYDPSYARRVSVLVGQIPLNRTGDLAFGVIAKALGVSHVTMKKWRTVGDDLYKPQFLAAIEVAEKELRKKIAEHLESIELGKIHAGVIKRAQGYRKKKIFRELTVTGPKNPPYSRFKRDDLIAYNKAFKLGLKITTAMSKGLIEIKMRERIEEMSIEKMKDVREEVEKVPSDTTAAKYCDQNMGLKEEQWTDTQKLDVESQSLADILAKTGILNK